MISRLEVKYDSDHESMGTFLYSNGRYNLGELMDNSSINHCLSDSSFLASYCESENDLMFYAFSLRIDNNNSDGFLVNCKSEFNFELRFRKGMTYLKEGDPHQMRYHLSFIDIFNKLPEFGVVYTTHHEDSSIDWLTSSNNISIQKILDIQSPNRSVRDLEYIAILYLKERELKEAFNTRETDERYDDIFTCSLIEY